MRRSSVEEMVSVIQKAVKKEVKRASKPVTEPVINREMQKMKREMRVMKREMREMKRLIETLSKQGTTADWNENPRTSLDHQIKKSEQAEFQLQFANKLPNTIYTKDKIRDESDGSIQIKLVDTISRETVKVGALSSIEIGIVVLQGNFGFKSHEN
ncbi:hypothetical protein LWI29_004286 [Acer saccharum]|uniref:Calmodulin binding protein-like N-terminal domain-containing protein n=1 Tax=Acer saccharum TaxID=4024 RepID=A0AA39SZX0_ACESA|nr:hypothetical protein LWI29_004286 [Acer saccharum]